ncbi:stage III sporulation protein AH [Alkalibacillus haloalkaliphilus]|uniref:stage III sporulation protein AH n=1 Tax=Alkalibacillus haloalkaliphilus TaxID=94136 RepID=UPI002936542D|nr:stage III sporulation protein AH [Alkalibacillus haloalkaliphilus]MDV2582122.1 stage III sporulation protein AH [Alkalibacillus haloalkaliphilus]
MLEINNQDIKGQDYEALLELALKKCDCFAFVQRKDMMEDGAVIMKLHNQLVEPIQNSLIKVNEQSSWIVTSLLEGTASVFYYELNEETKNFLLSSSDSLFDWNRPPLPEDLMFFKDDQFWLASCSHERFFIINDDYKHIDELIEEIRSIKKR